MEWKMRCWCRWGGGKGVIFNFGFLIFPAFAGHAFAWIPHAKAATEYMGGSKGYRGTGVKGGRW